LWVDKHKPQSLEELAVHKKKVSIFPLFHFCLSTLLDVYIEGYSFSWYLQVEEVKSWFEERLKTTKVNLYLSKLLPFVLFPWRSCTCFFFFF
jgi:cell cycle checkpoint protein